MVISGWWGYGELKLSSLCMYQPASNQRSRTHRRSILRNLLQGIGGCLSKSETCRAAR